MSWTCTMYMHAHVNCAKISSMTSVGKNLNFNQVRGCVTFLLSLFFSHYVLLAEFILRAGRGGRGGIRTNLFLKGEGRHEARSKCPPPPPTEINPDVYAHNYCDTL